MAKTDELCKKCIYCMNMNGNLVCNYIGQEHHSRYIEDYKAAYDPIKYCNKYIEAGSEEAKLKKQRKNHYNTPRFDKVDYDAPKATLDYTMFREVKIIKGVKI